MGGSGKLLLVLGFLVLVLVVRTVGCRSGGDHPPLGQVKGRVTLDGKPLPAGLIVMFQPRKGRPAVGTTDAEGNYEVRYRQDLKGANMGTNRVFLTWPTGFEGGVGFPAAYGLGSEIDVEVNKGMNQFDITMKSDE